MNIRNSSPAAEEKIKVATATKIFPKLVSTNRPLKKIFCLASISLLLSGCSAIAAIPLPLRLASNIHTAVTVIKNTDDNPDNDSKIISYLTEKLPEYETSIADNDDVLIKGL